MFYARCSYSLLHLKFIFHWKIMYTFLWPHFLSKDVDFSKVLKLK